MDVAGRSFDGGSAGVKASRFHTPSGTTARFGAPKSKAAATDSKTSATKAPTASQPTNGDTTNPMAKPFKKSKQTLLFSVVGGVILVVGLIAAVTLASLQQDVRQQASQGDGTYFSKRCVENMGFEAYDSELARCRQTKGTWIDKECTCIPPKTPQTSPNTPPGTNDASQDKGGILAKEGICGPGHRSWVASQKVCKTGVVQNK